MGFDFHPILIFIAGLVVLIVGAELTLRGASSLAAMLGVKPIVIGLTVVSIGTSLPELAVGITAVAEGKGAMAVGNIAGTNILNILFILGLSAAIRPLKLRQLSIRFDVPAMVIAALALFIMALNGVISQIEGAILFSGAIIYVVVLLRLSKKESADLKREYAEEYSLKVLKSQRKIFNSVSNILMLLGGMALTILGANLLVEGAVVLAQMLGMSDALIGLTIIAIGTSAPELASTIIATIKDDRDVAVGNLIGSSVSNIVVILGITCMSAPGGVNVSDDVLWLDLPLGAAVAIACYPVFRSDRMVSRREGIFFVLCYLAYFTFLIMRI